MTQKNILALAMLLGFALVAAAIFFSSNKQVVAVVGDAGSEYSIKRTDSTDWTYGDKDAPITIVEFSDFECPFCSRVHPTIKKLVDESDGSINWQYRHLPLPSHRNAEEAAMVSECVGKLAGNDAFWNFADTIFSNQQRVNSTFFKETYLSLGLSEDEMSNCMADKAVKEQVALDLATSRALGGSGTPFSIILKADGTAVPVKGALPYENWVSLLKI